ncbi:MAG: DNA polymerase III subunit alpha [Candidatus Shikimatogenerans sp. JK-2022]|nr:DNA polymerase III subunit alpha [Candidatus Shikimatogenerans bostrichidophilus]
MKKKIRNNLIFYNKKIKNKKVNFFNIHNHTHYNILNSTIKIDNLINKIYKYNMKVVGICDDNMMGSYDFIKKVEKFNYINKTKIKSILGYNIYIKDKNNNIYKHTLIVKNTIGYYNLVKISTYSHIYNSYKIDNNNIIYYIEKKIIKKYKKGLIFLTGNLNSEISYNILNNNIKKAIKVLLFWKKIFKKNIFLEIFINGIKNENKVNKILLKLSKKFNILYINQLDVYYLNKKDYIYHDILFCIKNKINFLENLDTKIYNKLPNNNFYFKKYSDIKNLFINYNNGFNNLNILLKKIKKIKFKKKNFLPENFNLSKKFLKKNKKKKNINYLYLKYITYKGAKKKYGKFNNIIKKRIKKELKLIKIKKFSNYFLIVKDIINIAKKLNIEIGPGRGSVAGSIIAYSINITNIDPLKYNLLFERFLNIYRKKMPDIDLDINYKKRKKIINYIIKKYGHENVSYIITYGKFRIKSAIRDCGRVFNLPLKNVNNLSNLVDIKKNKNINIFKNIYKNEYLNNKKYYKINNYNYNKIFNFKISLDSFILNISKNLEGLIRNIGIHACGIILSKYKLKNHIPLIKLYDKYTNKNVILTQYDLTIIENIGLLKIDLLGLRTLAVIKEALDQIKKNKKKINIDLFDKSTYKLFSKKQTLGIFQYESKGIRLLAYQIKPKTFEELIALNALYRPGTKKYISSYINRKLGKEKILYDLPIMKKYLKNTYGITIYQEQVILLAKVISGINEYEADILREAIAKKSKFALKIFKKKFFKNSLKKGYNIKILNKIWEDWKNFSAYAFNKSHSTCYAYLTYKTAYLKNHYKKEYLTSLLNNNLHNENKLKNILKEIKNLNIKILLPNINKSKKKFYIENKKYIRYSLSAIKGFGIKSTKIILKTRSKKKFISILDFLYRIDLSIINKKLIKILILTGSFNNFKIPIFNYFYKKKKTNINKIDKLIIKISNYKKEKKNFLYIKNKFKNYFNFKINNINDIKKIKYYHEQINFLRINLIDDFYKKEIKIFNILNIVKFNKINTNNYIFLLSGLIIDFYKYKNSYFLKIKDYMDYKKLNIKIIKINYEIINKYKYIFKKNIYKKNIILLKILNNKIIYIKFLNNILNQIKIIYFKIYYKYYFYLYKIIIKKIINLFKKIKSGIYISILFKFYNKKNICIYKKKIFNIKVNINILYKIKKKYPLILIKI